MIVATAVVIAIAEAAIGGTTVATIRAEPDAMIAVAGAAVKVGGPAAITATGKPAALQSAMAAVTAGIVLPRIIRLARQFGPANAVLTRPKMAVIAIVRPIAIKTMTAIATGTVTRTKIEIGTVIKAGFEIATRIKIETRIETAIRTRIRTRTKTEIVINPAIATAIVADIASTMKGPSTTIEITTMPTA
jgi:hypothetical protein